MGVYDGTADASKSYFAQPPCETIVAGDINGDCVIDFRDVHIMTLHWRRADDRYQRTDDGRRRTEGRGQTGTARLFE